MPIFLQKNRTNKNIRTTIFIVATLLLSILFPNSSYNDKNLIQSNYWESDSLFAPFSFPLIKEKSAIQHEADSIKLITPDVYEKISLESDNKKNIDLLFSTPLNNSFAAISSGLKARINNQFSEKENNKNDILLIQSVLLKLNEIIYNSGFIDRSKSEISKNSILIRIKDNLEIEKNVSLLLDSSEVQNLVHETCINKLPSLLQGITKDISEELFLPDIRYSKHLTELHHERQILNIPNSVGIVKKGELIIAKNNLITQKTKLKLNSFYEAIESRNEEQHSVKHFLGNLFFSFILIGLLYLYLMIFRIKIFNDNLQTAIILTSILLISLISKLVESSNLNLPYELLIPVPCFAMLMAILFDSRTAFYITIVNSFVIGGMNGNNFVTVFTSLSAGLLAAYTVRDIKSRTQLYRSILYAFVGYELSIVAFGLQANSPLEKMLVSFLFVFINSVISPVLTFALVYLIEKWFSVATDLKLIELDDLDHPLLLALSEKAPGTYQHTLDVAILTERAAEAIGANSLLAKVGALFHDIGKMEKPEYFIENQLDIANKHDLLKPETSAKIIRNHVTDGVELAREYKLPKRVIDFIQTHHGTTLIKFFYNKAAKNGVEIDENIYRYAGPLPHSKETAILMLADGIEASVRTLNKKSLKEIEETVAKITKQKFEEKQLNESNLTLAELNIIQEIFVKNLIGIAHPRISYEPNETTNMIQKVDEVSLENNSLKNNSLENNSLENKIKKSKIAGIDDAFGNKTSDV